MNGRRLSWMDALRGGAIMMVIYHHGAGQAATISDVPEVFIAVDRAFDPFRMPALMILSGLLLPHSLQKDTRTFVSGKVRKVLWPYLVWSALVVVAVGVAGGGINFIEFSQIFYDPPTYLWFMGFLFVYYMLALLLPSRWHLWMIPAGVIAAFVFDNLIVPGVLDNVHNVALSNSERFTYLLAFFFLGSWIARNAGSIGRFLDHTVVLFVAALVTVVGVVLSVSGSTVTFAPIFMLVPVAGFVVLRWVTMRISPSFLVSVGRDSLIYYVSHFLVIMVTSKVLEISGFTAWPVAITTLLIAPLGAALLLALLSRRGVLGWLFVFPEITATRSLRGAGVPPQ